MTEPEKTAVNTPNAVTPDEKNKWTLVARHQGGQVTPPRTINIGGKRFRLAVFRVESRDERGRPERLTNLPDDRTAELSEDPKANYFVCCWVNAAAFADHPELANWSADQ